MDWLRRGVFEFGKFSEAQRYTALKLKIMDRAKNIVRSRRGATDITSLPFIDQRYRGGRADPSRYGQGHREADYEAEGGG